MKGSLFIMMLIVAALLLATNALAKPKHPHADKFTVFGYLPEYRKNDFNYEAAFQTGMTHLIYFSIEIDMKTSLPSALDRLPTKEQAREARIAADKVGGKLLLGFGGNARSQGFPRMATNPKRRAKFLDALQKLLTEYEMDGVDYNWEYPNNAEEWKEWGKLMRESKEKLNGGPENNVVTFTMFNDPNHFDIINHFNLLDDNIADYVHCMVYDTQGRHSTMDFARQAIRYARTKNLPLKKFTLGVPFYGRDMHTGHPETYQEIVRRGLKNDKIDVAGTQFFNSRHTIRRKTYLAQKADIGGVMIWEIGQDLQPMDRKDSLMSALHEGILTFDPATKTGAPPKKEEAKKSEDGEL